MNSSVPATGNQMITHLRLADGGAISEAASLLRAGGLVAFPTETVYGLGADATSGKAVAAIYAAKGRPTFNPLIAHVGSLEDAQREGVFNAAALKLAKAFWPGPLTLVVPIAASCTVCELARAGLDSVALRAPSHPVARALLALVERPVAAPSANRSGSVSPTQAAHVFADLAGKVDLILDDGASDVGVESTIVACLGAEPVLLRPGGVTRSEIEQVLGFPLRDPEASNEAAAPIAPGMLASHYAPRATVRMNADSPAANEAALDFAHQFYRPVSMMRLDLSPSGDLNEAAANLFGYLRQLDASGAGSIAVARIPDEGLGEAINDRLLRAAAPRTG
jgi:L-threonylcarbamoyladenylate synthase